METFHPAEPTNSAKDFFAFEMFFQKESTPEIATENWWFAYYSSMREADRKATNDSTHVIAIRITER